MPAYSRFDTVRLMVCAWYNKKWSSKASALCPLYRKNEVVSCAGLSKVVDRKLGNYPLFTGGANPPDKRKEGVANVCY
ncbi:MAG: hypothetical protein ACI4D4_09615, partial [Lachnospira sp.]